MSPRAHLTIGQLSERSGVAPSALRYYEDLGLIGSERSAGNQRRYPQHMLRRVAFIRSAQRVGLTLDEVAAAECFSSPVILAISRRRSAYVRSTGVSSSCVVVMP